MKTENLFITICMAIFAFLILTLSSYSQVHNWEWVKRAGNNGNDKANSVAVDASGNIYVAGLFSGSSITFDSITLTTSSFFGNMFIVKYDANGNVLWAKSSGAVGINSNDSPFSVTVDASGNIYVIGWFGSSSVTFGSTTLTNAGNYDMFIVKYNSSGTILWAKSAGGNNGDYANSIAADASGNIYVTGWFSSSSITFGSTILTNAGGFNTFIVKYDGSGTILWAKSVEGNGSNKANFVTSEASGNIYVTGWFASSIIFDSITLTNADTAYFTDDVFLAKYDTNGNVLWAKSAGGTSSDDWANSVAMDASGNIYVTGVFESPTITFGSTTLTNAGYSDLFLAKYDATGNVLWAKSAGGNYFDKAISVTTDADGNIYMAGYFGSSSIIFGSTTLTRLGEFDTFIVKYDASGNVLWAEHAGGVGMYNRNIANSVTDDASGNIFLVGGFSYNSTFGSITLTSAGDYDMFIAKIGTTFGIESFENSDAITIYPNPASDIVTLNIDNRNNADLTLNIYNVIGTLIKSEILKQNYRQINIGDLSNGVYMVEVKSKDWTEKQKLIIQR